jgi:hypothetical protein
VGVVDDADREANMLEVVDVMETVIAELGELVQQDRSDLQELLRDPSTPRADIEAFVETHRGEREVILGRIAEAHFEFKGLASPEEWKKLAKSESQVLTMIAQRSLGEAALIE